MFNFFIKRKQPKPEIFPPFEFNHAIGFARKVIECEETDKDRIIILDFMLSAIREDIKTDLLSHIFYNKEHFDREFHYPIPLFYTNEQGQEFSLPDLGEKVIDLTEVCVLALPWNRESMKNQIKNIYNNDFIYQPSNHSANYFPYLGLCHAHGGLHSISAGIIHQKKGTIEANAYDITAAFPHLHTDGCNWFNSHTNEKKHELIDFRLGIIYELSKMKYHIENRDSANHQVSMFKYSGLGLSYVE